MTVIYFKDMYERWSIYHYEFFPPERFNSGLTCNECIFMIPGTVEQ